MAIAAVGFCVTALASWAGVRMFEAVLEDVAKSGGGIGAISAGIWESAQLPLSATWIGLITSLMAAMLLGPLARTDVSAPERTRPGAFALLMAAGLTLGLAPLLAFRPAIAFVWRAITPGTDVPAAIVMERLLAYEVISAFCFVAAVGITAAVTRLALRSLTSQAVSFVVTLALLVTVAVSAYTASSLRDTSARFHDVARYGRVSAIRR
jgi:hypothetical protein